MAFKDVVNVPITKIDTVIEVISKGDGSHERDQVMVSSNLTLTADIDSAEEATLLLPMASEAQQQPIVRYTDEHVKDGVVFKFDPIDRSLNDQELIERLEALADGTGKAEQNKVATQIDRCAAGISSAVVRVKPGQRNLRLFYEIAAPKAEDGAFEFQVIGPLPSFVIQGGGSISLLSILPRATTVESAVGLQNPNDEGSAIEKVEHDIAGRRVIGWFWQVDPLFKVRYRY